jgi:hypothetical protein
MPNSPPVQLASLLSMPRDDLSALWHELFQSGPPHQLRRQLMARILAYRIQDQQLRELRPSALQRLRQMGRALEKDPAAEISAVPAFKPGTRLICQWRDQTHVVTVNKNGYEYQGSRYQSLSEIARLITGIRWSGPLFFGLKPSPARIPASPRAE